MKNKSAVESLRSELESLGCLGEDFFPIKGDNKCIMVKNRNQWEIYTFGNLGWNLYVYSEKEPRGTWNYIAKKMKIDGFPY